jgi:serpin B
LILTNAIYFKAAWDEPFKKERTKDEPFHLDAKQQPNVPMMHHSKMSLRYLETDQFQMVELPYKRGELSMVLIVPKAIDGIGAVEKALTSDTLGKMLDAMEYKSVILTIPKFKITAEFGLADTLKAMGMADAFDRKHADFSGMETAEQATTDRLFINQVVHKAFVDVNEDGTEAAAATAVVMVTSAAMQAHVPPPIEVTADRPFLFLIRHHSSATILFMGRLMDPRD